MDINDYKQYEPINGKWYINKYLGSGAYGKVFEVERKDFGNMKSAMKIISIPFSISDYESYCQENYDLDEKTVTSHYYGIVEDFIKEFQIMSKIRGHSNIVSYEDHDVVEKKNGEFGWNIFIRMELLTPMSEYFREHCPHQADVVKLGIDMCKALEVCQKYHIIHRDIKPSNIFISENGDFKLGDFGVARTLEKTSSGLSQKGTYTYMAPEIFKGEKYGKNVDIYSLGIVMYKLLNNNMEPFRKSRMFSDGEKALSERMSNAPIPKPANADDELSRIILKSCSFNSNERYETPAQMRMELEELLAKSNKDVPLPFADVRPNGISEDADEATIGIYTEKNDITEDKSATNVEHGEKEMTVSAFESINEIDKKKDDSDDYDIPSKVDESVSLPSSDDEIYTIPAQESERKKRKLRTIVISISAVLCILVISVAMLNKSPASNKTDDISDNVTDNSLKELSYDPYTFDYQEGGSMNGLACVWKLVDGEHKYGFIGENRKVVIPCIYDDISRDIYDGKYIIVTQGDKKGVIDINNNLIIDVEYEDIRFDSLGYVNCYINGVSHSISTRLENITEINQMKRDIEQGRIKLYNNTSEYSLDIPDYCPEYDYSRAAFAMFSCDTEERNEYAITSCGITVHCFRGYEGSKDYSLYIARTYEDFYHYFVGDEIADGVTVEKVDFSYLDSGSYETSIGIYKVTNQDDTIYYLYKSIANKTNADDIASLKVHMNEDYYSKEKMDKIADSFEVTAK